MNSTPTGETAPETERIVVEGSEPSSRTLLVRFGDLVEKLLALGEPDEEGAGELLAGADLVLALENESDGFGRAAPGAPEDAGFAELVLAVSDAAFSAAHELIDDSDWDRGGGSLDGRTALARAVAGVLDPDLHAAVAAALLSCPPAPEAAIGEEFV